MGSGLTPFVRLEQPTAAAEDVGSRCGRGGSVGRSCCDGDQSEQAGKWRIAREGQQPWLREALLGVRSAKSPITGGEFGPRDTADAHQHGAVVCRQAVDHDGICYGAVSPCQKTRPLLLPRRPVFFFLRRKSKALERTPRKARPEPAGSARGASSVERTTAQESDLRCTCSLLPTVSCCRPLACLRQLVSGCYSCPTFGTRLFCWCRRSRQ